jgi:hypothetical protein
MRAALLLLPALSCASGPDLPEGWEEAFRVDVIVQRDNDTDDGEASLEHTVGEGGVAVHYINARFRCVQEVEAFGKVPENAGGGVPDLEVLVQPVDLHPKQAVQADCLYDVDLDVRLDPGLRKVRVWRRGDELAGETLPELVDDEEINVP